MIPTQLQMAAHHRGGGRLVAVERAGGASAALLGRAPQLDAVVVQRPGPGPGPSARSTAVAPLVAGRDGPRARTAGRADRRRWSGPGRSRRAPGRSRRDRAPDGGQIDGQPSPQPSPRWCAGSGTPRRRGRRTGGR